ncbi:Uncharacterised protein [Mycoplasmopsis caviae]|uniref:Uncharacterized protein n=1 Tax=Mycoplasmopsis caviae TaxID=55603 RepID=A0A3P8LI77_9BACT|nr:Uncharacterised protein [Mycoplasmopsis caviae]
MSYKGEDKIICLFGLDFSKNWEKKDKNIHHHLPNWKSEI